MLSRKLFFLSLVFLFCFPHKIFSSHSVSFNKNNSDFTTEKKRPHLLFKKLFKKLQRTKKITAALLAFPLPFGVLALHRIYLGTKAYVPLMYIATAGGIFGILPFIDFCILLLDNNIDRFYGNGKVFMWID